MAATLTPNYGWVQPEVGGDATTWGNELNNDLALIDAQVYSNEQATVLIGAMMLWATPTPPTNWLLCQGQSLATVGTYAALFAVIGYTYGGSGANFNLPNFQNVFPIGASSTIALGATGGANTVTLTTAQLPSHTHTIADPGHNHVLNQTPHQHPDGTHTHGASGSQSPHSHGGVIIGYGPPDYLEAGGVTGLTTGNTDTQQPAVSVSVNASGANIGVQNANLSLNAAATGITGTGAVGSGAAVPTVPPFRGINFIIRFQ